MSSMQRVLTTLSFNQIPEGFIIHAGGNVRISGTCENGRHRIDVMDTGKLAQALDFSKRHSSQGTQGERGSGLGLVRCHDLAKKCGGGLHIDSELGKGTRVTLPFPD